MMFDRVLETPVGFLGICVSHRMLESIRFVGPGARSRGTDDPLIDEVAAQLKTYFEKPAHRFALPLHLRGTAFQSAVWHSLQAIPAGEVRTYGDIAHRLKSGARAVGNACRSNPCPIVVPCHRVVAASGPGGYAGKTDGEILRIKRRLLEHEGLRLNWS